jgi:hypothetical protein
MAASEIGCQREDPLLTVVCPPALDHNVSALDETCVSQSLEESGRVGEAGRVTSDREIRSPG